MTTAKSGYIQDLLVRRVADLELSDLRFLKAESSRDYYPADATLAEVFGSKVQSSKASSDGRKGIKGE